MLKERETRGGREAKLMDKDGTYVIRQKGSAPYIQCLACDAPPSFHPQDIEHRFCSVCHAFHRSSADDAELLIEMCIPLDTDTFREYQSSPSIYVETILHNLIPGVGKLYPKIYENLSESTENSFDHVGESRVSPETTLCDRC